MDRWSATVHGGASTGVVLMHIVRKRTILGKVFAYGVSRGTDVVCSILVLRRFDTRNLFSSGWRAVHHRQRRSHRHCSRATLVNTGTATTLATSLVSTTWPIELPDATCLSISSADTPCAAALSATGAAVRSVRVSPGWTTVTLIPAGPHSSAMFLLSAATAILRMMPTAFPVWRAAKPLTLTMRPQPFEGIPATTAWAQRMQPVTLMSRPALLHGPARE